MTKQKTFLHSIAMLVLAVIGYVIGGHIPFLNQYLDMTVGGALSVLLAWGYTHFGIVPSVAQSVRAGMKSPKVKG